jgi:mono/diheme cytochrome c family protein
VALVAIVGLLLLAAGWCTRGAGLSARRDPWPGEGLLAALVRDWTLPAAYRTLTNPVAGSPAAVRAGMEHWADHCAGCHGNDGRGNEAMGQNLFPPAPDMQSRAVQSRSDGALFYAIEEGVPWTGMPAWSTGTADGERQSWELVSFVRHLPALTPEEIEEMETLNPRSARDMEQEREIDDFLSGGP